MGFFDTVEKDNKIKDLEDRLDQYQDILKNERQEHKRAIKDLEAEQALELRQKEFDIDHFKDDELKTREKQINDLTSKVAVLTKENTMLEKLVDVNADIIDVKALINKLVEKLPTMDLKNLTITTESKK